MKPDEFEQKLSQQPVKEVPPAWRAEILAAARAAEAAPHASRRTPQPWLSTINSQLAQLLWPHPKAWAGLTAVWIGILALHLATRESAPQYAEKAAPASPEMVVELRKEQKLYAELLGVTEPREADRPKVFVPSPRSGRTELLAG